MDKILIVTIRAKGGGAEKIIEQLTNNNKDKFIWVNMESLLGQFFLYRYIKFMVMVYKNIHYVDKVVIGTEGILGLVLFPFKVFYNKKFILWNHCYFDDYKKFLSNKNRFLFNLSYSIYPVRINASPASKNGVFIPNPYVFNRVESRNKFLSDTDFTLLSISSLAKLKNVNNTIELLCGLPSNYRLNIYGDGVERLDLELLVRKNCLNERVTFFGYQENPFSLISNSPSVLIINSYTEALPTIILESIEHNVPVIVRAYNGVEYWRDFNTVFVFDEITPHIVISVVHYFQKISNLEYKRFFDYDISILESQHDFNQFVSALDSV